MITFNYKRVNSDAKCQNYAECYKPTDAEVLAFYISHREDISKINENNIDDTYKRLLYGNGVYFLFNDAKDKEDLYIYIGRSTQGVSRCGQHINKTIDTDARMYNKWSSVIYFTGALQNWSVDNIYDLERLFIGFFKSDDSKWKCLNIQSGTNGTSDIGELNTKIVAILSFLAQSRYGLRLDDISKTKTIVDSYLEETAKSAIEIRLEAERLAKQEFKDDILDKLSEQAFKDLEYGRKIREYTEFKSKVKDSSYYIMSGRIFNIEKDRKHRDVITPEKYAYEAIENIPDNLFDGVNTFLEIASKSGNMPVPIIDKLMSDDINLPINQGANKNLDWNRNKISRLKHIVEHLIFAQATSYEGYSITCETLLKCVDKHLKSMDVDAAREFNILPNVKYNSQYIEVSKDKKNKDKTNKLKEIIKAGFGEDMTFDIVVSNPPYNDDMYLEFIRLAQKISLKLACMIVPAKWAAKRGKENDSFRQDIVPYINRLVWYPNSRDIFEIYEAGGIAIFTMDKDRHDIKMVSNRCNLNNALNSEETPIEYKEGQMLLGSNIKSIVDKCSICDNIVSRTNMKKSMYLAQADHGGYKGDIEVYDGDKLGGWVYKSELKTDYELDKYKVTMHIMPGFSMAYLNDNVNSKDRGRALGSNKVNVIGPNQVPSANFQILGTFDTETEAKSYKSYLETKLCRFLTYISICANTVTSEFYRLVPDINKYDHMYTDSEVYSL